MFLVLCLCIDCSQLVELKVLQKMFVVSEMEAQIYGQLLNMSMCQYNMKNWTILFKKKIYCKIETFVSYQVIYMPP